MGGEAEPYNYGDVFFLNTESHTIEHKANDSSSFSFKACDNFRSVDKVEVIGLVIEVDYRNTINIHSFWSISKMIKNNPFSIGG